MQVRPAPRTLQPAQGPDPPLTAPSESFYVHGETVRRCPPAWRALPPHMARPLCDTHVQSRRLKPTLASLRVPPATGLAFAGCDDLVIAG